MSWSKRPVHWEDDDAHYWSIVFTWDLYEWSTEIQPELDGKPIVVGGPAVRLQPEWVPEWVETRSVHEPREVFKLHNPLATRTSRGCPNACAFCGVRRIEGEFRELSSWPAGNIIMDDNLLACSRAHFDHVIDELKLLPWCDFNQGLDCRMLTKYHAERLAELRDPLIRLSLDSVELEDTWVKALRKLRAAGIPKGNIRSYVLIGYDDTPADALERVELVHSFRIRPNPMRYHPLDAKERGSYVAPGWTMQELRRFMSYWANLRWTGGVPFGDYVPHGERR